MNACDVDCMFVWAALLRPPSPALRNSHEEGPAFLVLTAVLARCCLLVPPSPSQLRLTTRVMPALRCTWTSRRASSPRGAAALAGQQPAAPTGRERCTGRRRRHPSSGGVEQSYAGRGRSFIHGAGENTERHGEEPGGVPYGDLRLHSSWDTNRGARAWPPMLVHRPATRRSGGSQ